LAEKRLENSWLVEIKEHGGRLWSFGVWKIELSGAYGTIPNVRAFVLEGSLGVFAYSLGGLSLCVVLFELYSTVTGRIRGCGFSLFLICSIALGNIRTKDNLKIGLDQNDFKQGRICTPRVSLC
jgi:hypothetical protein